MVPSIKPNGSDKYNPEPVATRVEKYHQAAVAYFIYGVIYLSGAVYLAEAGVVERSGWVWFLVGLGFVLVLPPLIWRGFTWFVRVLAVLVLLRIAGLIRVIAADDGATVPLPGGTPLPMAVGAVVFLLVAAATCAMLVRAGWARERTADVKAHTEP